MLRIVTSLLAPIALFVHLTGCQEMTASGASPPPSQTASTSKGETTKFKQDLTRIEEIAAEKKIFGDHGSSFIYIDGPTDGSYMFVHETFSSRSKYKSITPIVGIEQDNLIIDCSFVRSIEDMSIVSVGSYCRGQADASLETMEDAISDEHLLSYSSSLPWLSEVGSIVGCEHPLGMAYAGHYIVRCQSDGDDETTGNISITVLAPDSRVVYSITGFEFTPATAEMTPKALTFWGLSKDSHHAIFEKAVP